MFWGREYKFMFENYYTRGLTAPFSFNLPGEAEQRITKFGCFYLEGGGEGEGKEDEEKRKLKLVPAQLLAVYNKKKQELHITYPEVLEKVFLEPPEPPEGGLGEGVVGDAYKGLFTRDLEKVVDPTMIEGPQGERIESLALAPNLGRQNMLNIS